MGTDPVTAVAVLRDMAFAVDDEDHALAALAALTDPDVKRAALAEQAVLERLAAARPHLVRMPGNVAEVDAADGETRWLQVMVTDCPDCTRGCRSIGGVMVCTQLPDRVGVMGGSPGDIVACGRER